MKKLHFQKRLLLCVFSFLAILILSGSCAFFGFAIHNVQATEKATMEQIVERFSLQIDSVYRQMGIAATATVTNPQLQSIIYDLNSRASILPYEQLQYNSTITANMTTNLFYLANAQNAFLYNADKGYCYYTGLYLWDEEALKKHAADTRAYRIILQNCPDSYILLPPHANPWKPEEDPVISVIKRFFNNDRIENALLEIQLPYSALEETCHQDSFENTRQILIIDDNGTILFPYHASAYVLEPTGLKGVIEDLNKGITSGINSDYLFSSHKSAYTGWHTVLIGSPSLLRSQIRQYLIATLLFLILVSGATLAVLTVLTRRLTRPLNRLAHEVQEVSLESLDIHIGSDSPDELTALNQSFHAMFQKLRTSIQEVYEMRIRESNARLHALQSQINPHFLYNTLNSIGAAARIYGGDTATQMCQSLASMMRYITSMDQQNLLADELTHTRNYLALCQVPYGESFIYSINVPPEMNRLIIPKLTIQPIVENAISHGFASSDPPFSVEVNGYIREGGRWCLCVSDNGCGFSEQKIRELEVYIEQYKNYGQSLDTGSLDIGGMGLKNIFSRLLITYDNDVDFTIQNNRIGCTVTITGPILSEEEND